MTAPPRLRRIALVGPIKISARMSTRPGRPRNAITRLAILRAAAELLASGGYDAMAISAIASRSGAGRQTIYRLWGSKATLAAEVVMSGLFRLPELRMHRTASLRDDLVALLGDAIDASCEPTTRSLIRALVTASAETETRPTATINVVTMALTTPLADRVSLAMADGSIRSDIDPEVIVDAIVGVLVLETLGGTELDFDRIATFVDILLQGAQP